MHKLPSEAPLAKRFRMSSLRPMGCSTAVQRDRKSAVAMPCMRTSDIGNGAYRLASDTDSTERVVEGAHFGDRDHPDRSFVITPIGGS